MRQSKTFLLVIGMLTISVATAIPGPAAPYSTQLFSLLTNGSSPVDGKNHYQKEFDQQFDAMLAQSALAKAAKPGVPLKQRLMSGPQPEPLTLQDKAGGQQYVYYEACQAHACDDTSLVVLYAPASRAMLGRLHLDGKEEYLGSPSVREKALLDRGKPTPQARIVTDIANYKTFRMKSADFDKLVAEYCKQTYNDIDHGQVSLEYACSKEAGITQIKVDSREGSGQGSAGNYMMSILMFLSWESYAPLKAQLERQLGRAQTSGKDYTAWRYTADKQLNARGTPSIRLSRDADDKSTTLQLGVEQGP